MNKNMKNLKELVIIGKPIKANKSVSLSSIKTSPKNRPIIEQKTNAKLRIA